MRIRDLFRTMTEMASSNQRKLMMSGALNSENRDLIIQIFDDCYGGRKYYVKQIDTKPLMPELCFGSIDTIDENYDKFHTLLDKLANKEITGNAARDAVHSVLQNFDFSDQEILNNILQGNLKIGFTGEQLNTLLGKKKKEFECSLAFNLEKVTGVNPIDGTYYASRKLDGCRCTCFITTELDENGNTYIASEPKFISRQGKEFTTLDNIKPAIEKLAIGFHYVGKLVFDGEVCIIDDNGDEHFDWIMKEIRRKDHTIEKPCYQLFDVITEEEFFDNSLAQDKFSDRNFYLINAFHHMYDTYGRQPELRLLQQELITSQEDFDRWSKLVADNGWEGFMLRKDVPYRSGRTKDLLKVKKFQDAEYKVTSLDIGKVKYGTEIVSAVTNIFIEHKDNVVSVGSGITREQRQRWFEHPEEIIGKVVTVQYFEETKDSKTGALSLRFPVLKYVYENGRDV